MSRYIGNTRIEADREHVLNKCQYISLCEKIHWQVYSRVEYLSALSKESHKTNYKLMPIIPALLDDKTEVLPWVKDSIGYIESSRLDKSAL